MIISVLSTATLQPGDGGVLPMVTTHSTMSEKLGTASTKRKDIEYQHSPRVSTQNISKGAGGMA
jgi:hypothetical protein